MTEPGERARDDETTGRDDADAPPATVPIDPEGDDPEHIPDPMPDDLRRTGRSDRAFDESEPMEGDAPTG